MTGLRAALAALAVAMLAGPAAAARPGPCIDDGRSGLVCGSGPGAPRVIAGTVSPSGRLALAWRNPAAPPDVQPDGDVELLLVRLDDGAVLGAGPGAFWDTGQLHINRVEEIARWSSDSRWLLRARARRYDFDELEVIALGADDSIAARRDLQPELEQALRGDLQRRVKDAEDYVVLDKAEPLKIAPDGRLTLPLTLWKPKAGPFFNYDVTLQAVLRNGELAISQLRWRFLKRERWPGVK
jgi:hypothetical protein